MAPFQAYTMRLLSPQATCIRLLLQHQNQNCTLLLGHPAAGLPLASGKPYSGRGENNAASEAPRHSQRLLPDPNINSALHIPHTHHPLPGGGSVQLETSYPSLLYCKLPTTHLIYPPLPCRMRTSKQDCGKQAQPDA